MSESLPPPHPEIQCLRTVPYQYFWYHTTLDASSQVEEGIEMLVLNITLCLFATWVFLYIILIIRMRISVLVSVPVASFLLSLRTFNYPEDRFMYTHQCPQYVSHGRGHSYLKQALDGTLWSPSLTPTSLRRLVLALLPPLAPWAFWCAR